MTNPPEGDPSAAGSALQILGDPTRRAILEVLAAEPLPVGELAKRLPVSRPAVSQHLGALKAAGLVADRAEGTRRIYRVDPDGLALLRTYLDRMWDQVLHNLRDGLAAAPEPAPDTESAPDTGPAPDTDPERNRP